MLLVTRVRETGGHVAEVSTNHPVGFAGVPQPLQPFLLTHIMDRITAPSLLS